MKIRERINVLILGGGSREHGYFVHASKSPQAGRVYVAPGNAGIPEEQRVNLSHKDFAQIHEFCQVNNIQVIIVGPEAPIEAGIADYFKSNPVPHPHGTRVFAPTRWAGRLEWSKIFTKNLCTRLNLRTAAYYAAVSAPTAEAIIRNWCAPIVVKKDGLAAGKGVKVADTIEEAIAFSDKLFAWGDERVLLERKLEGREISIIAFTDGENVRVIRVGARDHKLSHDGDTGENTGGMGVVTPVSDVNDALIDEAVNDFFLPTLQAMKEDGNPYQGFLFGGFMIVEKDGEEHLYLLEWNCRGGDPEIALMLELFEPETDFLEYVLACSTLGGLKDLPEPKLSSDVIVGVVMAEEGYPGTPKTGRAIQAFGPVDYEHGYFHAGTKRVDGELCTNGGRVLLPFGRGTTFQEAHDEAYARVHDVTEPSLHFRTDIGKTLKPTEPLPA